MFAYSTYVVISSMLIAVVILAAEGETASSDDGYQYLQKRQAVSDVRKYCGRSLSSTLQMICDGVYNSRFKKSNRDARAEEEDEYAFSHDLYPYKSSENARRMLRFRRDSRGIYEECCLKSCSRDELRSYCGAR